MAEDFAAVSRQARALVAPERIRALCVPQPARVARATALLWAQLAGAWALALFGPLWLLPLSFLVLCAVVQGMLLWTHEASHYTLVPGRRRNDLWADLAFAGPLGMSVAAYRAKHTTHHGFLGTARDGDRDAYFAPVRGAAALARVLALTLSGVAGVRLALAKYMGGEADGKTPDRPNVPRWASLGWTVAFNLGLLAACVAVGRWWLYPLLWLYPILSVAILLNVVRTTAEHQPDGYPEPGAPSGEGDAMRPAVRTTLPGPLEKWLLYQANFNYHVEHHLFPKVPQHNLAALHAELRRAGFYERRPEMLQRSGVARFLCLVRGGPGSSALASAGATARG